MMGNPRRGFPYLGWSAALPTFLPPPPIPVSLFRRSKREAGGVTNNSRAAGCDRFRIDLEGLFGGQRGQFFALFLHLGGLGLDCDELRAAYEHPADDEVGERHGRRLVDADCFTVHEAE